MEKRVAVEQFLNVPLGAERAFPFKGRARPRRSRLRRALAPAFAVAVLSAVVAAVTLAPSVPHDAGAAAVRAALDRSVAPSADAGEAPSR